MWLNFSKKIINHFTKKNKAHIGISLDGDADRIIIVMKRQNSRWRCQIIAMLAKKMEKKKNIKRWCIGTLMSNYGLEKYF